MPFAAINASDDLSFFNDEIPIVLSATRLAQPQTEAPASITIIDRQLIKLSGAKEIPELFRLVPGMHVNYFRGNTPTVGYQGINSEYPQGVQVLVDGRSLYNPLFGGVNWRSFPITIEEIERIEVIRGANSTSFGSNAFQSVINITTIHSSQSVGTQVKTTVGERGYKHAYVRTGGSFSDLSVRFTASHTDNDGYANNTDDSRQDAFNARIDYQLTPRDTLQVNASAINSLLETANPDPSVDGLSIDYDPTDPRRTVDESSFSLHAKWEHNADNNQLFITQLSYSRFKAKDKVTSEYIDSAFIPNVDLNISTDIDYTTGYDRWDFEFEHQLQPSENTRLTWGLVLRSDRVYEPLWLGTSQKLDNSLQRLFSNVEWRPADDLILNFGALWEHSQLVGDDFAPRVAANYLLTPQQSIRFSASRSFRTPVIVENKFDAKLVFQTDNIGEVVIPIFSGTQGLDSETVDSFELGYHGLFYKNALTLDVKVFRNEYNDLIDAVACDFGSCPFLTISNVTQTAQTSATILNLYHAEVNGYEIELNYKPNRNSLLHMGYSYNHVSVGRDMGDDFKPSKIDHSIPKDIFNLLAAHTFNNGVWGSIAYYYTGSMENLDSGTSLGPMRRVDLNAGKTFNVGSRQTIDLNFTLQVALDKNEDFLDEFTELPLIY